MIKRNLCSWLLLASLALGGSSSWAATIYVSGILRGTNTWYATNEYVLDGWVYVVSNAVLNIEAGTVIRGKKGATQPNYGALFVCRGGKIFALGSPGNPIIFTAEDDDLNDPYDIPLLAEPDGRGLWGGIVILGYGKMNRPDAEAVSGTNPDGSYWQIYEGLSDAIDPVTGQHLHRWGGNDNDDSSGAMRFVSIRYAGKIMESNKELNGLSMAGVGRGTIIEFVEVYACADDGFEWWGGAVNSRYLVSSFCSDEMFDMDQGHEGKHQFWFGIQGVLADEGLEMNGQPSGGANVNVPGLTPLGEHQIYNVTLIGMGGPGSGSEAMNTRSEYYGKIHNSVFTKFRGRDQVATVPNYYGTVTHNLFWENVGGRGIVNTNANAFANPLLVSIDWGQNEALDPRPQPNSPVFQDYKTPPNDGFFCPVPYKGAFNANDNWLLGWTALYQNGHLKQKSTNIVAVSGILRGTNNWTADNEYLLDGWVYVVSNAVLNIEAGTVIRGKKGATQPNYGALFVCRGGKIFALGSPGNPIIFTAEDDDLNDPYDIPLLAEPDGRGLWGGIVILGYGKMNRPDAEAVSGTNPDGSYWQIYEGLSDAIDPVTGQHLHRWGGNDNDDSSGAMRFVSIRYAGKIMESNKELNGLSMAGVGRGTIIEFVEVYACADDGFEWWGGAVNSRYLVSSFCSDEMFDMDQGHEGKHQFWFGIQGVLADEGLEMNGQPSGGANVNVPGLTPLGEHQIYNVTLIGMGGPGSGSEAMNTRSEYYGKIHNSVFTKFRGRDQVATVPNYYGTVTHNLFWENVGGRGIVNTNANAFANPLLVSIDWGQNEALDPRPQPNSPVFQDYKITPQDGYFIAAPYKGALKDVLWFADWTALLDNRHIKPTAKALTCEQPQPAAVVPPNPPTLTIALSGTNAVITCTSQVGYTYVLESTGTLPGNWAQATGVTPSNPQTGTGGTLMFTVPVSDANFFRVKAQ